MDASAAAWLAGAAVLSAATVATSLAYARRRGLLDQPGRRRSHRVPTPRGGGIGIVLAVVLLAAIPAWLAGDQAAPALGAAMLAVAAVGWWDDHHPLSARLRLVVHCAASGVAALAILAPAVGPGVWLAWAVCTLLLAWSVNLHNFIDGIDGLLCTQAAAVFAVLAVLADVGAAGDLARWSAVACAACLGFLPFNLPRARIFLGDVGSGAIGLLLGALAVRAWRDGVLDAGALLMLSSACAVDATATLLSRMLRGRRWWRPHREHLYQWLVRGGLSHLRVTLLYLGWTALLVPAALLARAWMAGSVWAATHPGLAESLYFFGWPATLVAAAMLAWWAGKRACLRRARNRKPRCASPA